MQTNTDILPQWVTKQNDYFPVKDNQRYLSKSILEFLRLFRHFHVRKNEKITELRAGARFVLVIGLIVLLALSKNMFFFGIVLASFLSFLSFSKIDVLKKTLSTCTTTAFFTFLIMLPSYFLYHSTAFITITAKVFISTGILSLFALLTPWNKITGVFGRAKFSQFIVFILNLTISYILILGNIAHEMLFALKLRSVGKNKCKEKSFSGILGTVFLKSISLSEETRQSMECRLFSGKFEHPKSKINPLDFFPIIVLIFYIILFIYIL